jgi:hypothetical protein
MRRLLADRVRYSLPGREVPIECARCETITPKPIGWLLEHDRLRCPECDELIHLDTRRPHALFGEAQARAREIDEAMERAGACLTPDA